MPDTDTDTMTWAEADARAELLKLRADAAALRLEVGRLRPLAADYGRMEDELASIRGMCREAPAEYRPSEAVAYTVGLLGGRAEAAERRLAAAEDQLRASRQAP
jgi:hypothetical protein